MPMNPPSTSVATTWWKCKVAKKTMSFAPGVDPQCVYSHKSGKLLKASQVKRKKTFPTCIVPDNGEAERMFRDWQVRQMMIGVVTKHAHDPKPLSSILGKVMNTIIHDDLVQPFWGCSIIHDGPDEHLRVASDDPTYRLSVPWEDEGSSFIAKSIGEFFMDYARETNPDALLEYTMSNKDKKIKEIEEVNAGNVKARLYPDGRVCVEHSGGMEELWIPANDVGSLIDLMGQIAEKTGARPTSPARESGVSYQGPGAQFDPINLAPGPVVPVVPGQQVVGGSLYPGLGSMSKPGSRAPSGLFGGGGGLLDQLGNQQMQGIQQMINSYDPSAVYTRHMNIPVVPEPPCGNGCGGCEKCSPVATTIPAPTGCGIPDCGGCQACMDAAAHAQAAAQAQGLTEAAYVEFLEQAMKQSRKKKGKGFARRSFEWLSGKKKGH